MGTPFMNEVELNFALEAVRNEHLGQGRSTDLLTISLSVNDSIGHQFGPYSPKVADTTLRTDRFLASFLSELDKILPLSNVWKVLSVDHGVAPSPKLITDHKLGMGKFRPVAVREAVEEALIKDFEKSQWIEAVEGSYITLNLAALERHRLDRAKVEEVAAEVAASVPGIQAGFTRTQLLSGKLPNNPLARKAANSFNPGRSRDIFFIVSVLAVPSSSESGSTHGSPWNYDSQVPLILWGSAFNPSVYAEPAHPIDMAATLAAALGLTQPSGAQGLPLVKALR